VKTLPKPNLVQLSCEDHDPKFAQTLLLFFAETGNQMFRRVSSGAASEEVRYLERNVAELRRQADDVAARMREFQETHQIVDLESQARAVVAAVAMLSSQRMAKRMELDVARSYSSADEATARQLALQLSVMDEQLRDLEATRGSARELGVAGGADRKRRDGILPEALAVPKLRAEYETLYRDRKVVEATLVFALERLEAAKANVARDVSTFQVLDPPSIAERHSSPRRGKSVLLAAAVGFVAAVGFEWLRRAR
jgi:tyrosine-protein kinase Etk/Wzc